MYKDLLSMQSTSRSIQETADDAFMELARRAEALLDPWCANNGVQFRSGNGTWAFFRNGRLLADPDGAAHDPPGYATAFDICSVSTGDQDFGSNLGMPGTLGLMMRNLPLAEE